MESVARQGRQEGAGGVSEVGLGIAECACQQVVIHDNKSRFLGTKSLRMTTREEGGDRVSAAYEPSSTRLRDPPPPLHRTCWCGTSIQAQLVCDSLQGFDAERDVIFEVDAQISCAIYDVLAFDVAREGFVFHLFTN